MFSKMKIGDFARYNQVSIQALRYYEEIHLLAPIWVDPITNYRYYHIKQSAVIDNIQFFQQLNFSLAEIKQIMNDTDNLTELNELVEKKKNELTNQLASIQLQLQAIKNFQEGALTYQNKQHCQTIEICEFPARYILSYPISQNIYTMSEEEYEFSLREFKNQRSDSNQFKCVGSLMPRQSFIDQSFISKELFIFTNKKNPLAKQLPKGTYATFYCHSFKEELHRLKSFHLELEQKNYQVIGDYICEVLYEKNKTSDINRSMFIRMQIPIKQVALNESF